MLLESEASSHRFSSCDLVRLLTRNFAIRSRTELSEALCVKILTTIADVRAEPKGKARVLVPTMGALHKAHGELIRIAREAAGEDGQVAVSIFVNPLQF